MRINAVFHLKTALYGVTPGGFGQYRKLRSYKDSSYIHDLHKHPVRNLHNSTRGWGKNHKRTYRSYSEYVTHQEQKYREIIRKYGGFSNITIVQFRRRFYRRFKNLISLLPKNAIILCLGARQGTEVEVLRDVGFYNAYGIDLYPGPENPFVKHGDFMHLRESDASIDCIYTNSVDHAFSLEKFIAENIRVLKPSGYALYDLPKYSGSRSPGAFETMGWDHEDEIIQYIQKQYKNIVANAIEEKWHWMLFHKPIHNSR